MIRQVYIAGMLFLHDVKEQVDKVFTSLSSLACFTVIVLLLLEFAFHLADINVSLYFRIHSGLMAFFMGDVLVRFFVIVPSKWRYFLRRPLDCLAFVPVVLEWVVLPVEITFFMTQVILLGILLGRLDHLQVLLTWLRVRPAQLVLLAFMFVIFVGALLLSLPVATQAPGALSFVDALFTSCSAVCVTGLVVNVIGQDFTLFGQLVVLFLIQIGGLGIMSFSVLLTVVLRKKFSQSDTMRLQENYATVNLGETVSAIWFIFKFTVFFELMGAMLLMASWQGAGYGLWKTFYFALFHSVSAFCNAGFSLFSDSLVGFQTHVPTVMVISFLIIFGGMGFPVLFNMAQRFSTRSSPLKMQSRLAIRVTLVLLVVGTGLLFFSERNASLQGMPFLDQLQISFFQSVTSRTAGFNTIDIGLFQPATVMVLMVLMIIGASPGSTGGGIKTTTFGLIMIAFWNNLKSSFRFDYQKRTIDPQSVMKAFSTLVLVMGLILGFSFVLFQTEVLPVQALFFEVVSAFGTVGLSLGATPLLSVVGKWVIVVVMFIGRMGPFVFFYAFLKEAGPKPCAYPVEKVVIV